MKGKTVRVQSVKRSADKFDTEEILAQLCYHYPQYTMEAAAQLSYRKVRLLLKVANKQKAIDYYNLVQIMAAPHTKKGQGVKKLSEHFKKIADGK